MKLVKIESTSLLVKYTKLVIADSMNRREEFQILQISCIKFCEGWSVHAAVPV